MKIRFWYLPALDSFMSNRSRAVKYFCQCAILFDLNAKVIVGHMVCREG